MALGNQTIATVVYTDTNDQGRYIAPSTSVVGEVSTLVVSRPRSTNRLRADGRYTPQQACTFTLNRKIWNPTTLVFDEHQLQVSYVADSAVTSSALSNQLAGLAGILTAPLLTSNRNGTR
jgi:hypothetical protein